MESVSDNVGHNRLSLEAIRNRSCRQSEFEIAAGQIETAMGGGIMSIRSNILTSTGIRMVFVAGTALSSLAYSPALAQPAAANGESASIDESPEANEGMEIVVTATRRKVFLQDVPLAISAVDGDALARDGAREFNDYLRSVAGVSFVDRGPTENRIIIRGISDTASTEPTTGVYIDETPVTQSNRSADLNLFDVERVEVLRGPQGTLYGAGSMGGTVRVILNKPAADRFAAAVDGTYSVTRHGGGNFILNGMVNVPIVEDTFALRAVAYMREDGGFIDNVATGLKDVNEVQVRGGRLLARLTPTDRLTIQAGATYQKTSAGSRPQEDLLLGNLQQSRLYTETVGNEWQLYNVEVNYDLDWGQIVSSSSYYTQDARNGLDVSLLVGQIFGINPPVPVGLENRNSFGEFVQEIRLSSSGSGPFSWIAGLYYSDRKVESAQTGDARMLPPPFSSLGLPLVSSLTESWVTQYAVFGELSYDITSQVQATFGLRGFKVEQERVSRTFPSIVGGGVSTIEAETSETSTNLKFLLSYQPTKNHLVYVQAAQGYRIGGVNNPVPAELCGDDLAEIGLTEVRSGYDSDSVWNYEVGSKNTFANGRATLNAAAFYIDWKNIQIPRSLQCGYGFQDNAGAATSKGVELEIVLRPTHGLDLASSLSYTKTELKETVPGTGNPGDPLPNVPEWSISASAQYTFPISTQLDAYIRGQFQYIGSSSSDFSDAAPVIQPGYEIGSIRLGVQHEKWEASLFVNNLFDKKAYTWIREVGSGTGFTGIVNRPRTVGVSVRANY